MPPQPMRKKIGRLLIVSGPVILLDQASKAVVLNTMRLYESIPVIPGFFNLTHIHNPGGAFGFLASQSAVVRTFFFLVVAFLAMGLILHFYLKTPAHPPYSECCLRTDLRRRRGQPDRSPAVWQGGRFSRFLYRCAALAGLQCRRQRHQAWASPFFVLHLVFNRMPV